MTENQKKSRLTEADINKITAAIILFWLPLSGLKCLECGGSIRTVEIKEVERQNRTGWSLKFFGCCMHTWRIMLFPISEGAFEGEVRYKGETYEIVIAKPNAETEATP